MHAILHVCTRQNFDAVIPACVSVRGVVVMSWTELDSTSTMVPERFCTIKALVQCIEFILCSGVSVQLLGPTHNGTFVNVGFTSKWSQGVLEAVLIFKDL